MGLQVAATLNAVKENLGSETIIFFTSDHGAQLPYGKWNNYDYSVRAPLLVCWPGVIEPGTHHGSLILFVDILPTLIEIGGGTPPELGYGEGELDGYSFLPLLKGKTNRHRAHVFSTNSSAAHHTYPIRSLRTEQFRYIQNVYPKLNFTTQTDHNPKAESHYLWQSWVKRAGSDPKVAEKVNRYHRRPKEELYDMKNDPHEQHNLAANPDYADELESHRKIVNQWIEQSGNTLQKHGRPMKVLLPLER